MIFLRLSSSEETQQPSEQFHGPHFHRLKVGGWLSDCLLQPTGKATVTCKIHNTPRAHQTSIDEASAPWRMATVETSKLDRAGRKLDPRDRGVWGGQGPREAGRNALNVLLKAGLHREGQKNFSPTRLIASNRELSRSVRS